ncbi:LacI family DNA-binding transcriptional regulator [Oerskovia flava]|uniref:LacI family DNA-binding transcriptional regulator n=1 Tax=Oerskovia flava TaxID=2986422 RepID=UPI00223F72A6|nr:LacI family DNA-binding transcriptional regulator [Oerskovia sp. JB1-3-2]
MSDAPDDARERASLVTLAVVARRAGVSVPTVSRVLNARPGVAEATRGRVVGELERAGYVVGHRRAPRLLDLVIPEVGSLYESAVVEAVQAAARSRGVSTVLTTSATGDWLAQVTGRTSGGVIAALHTVVDREVAWSRSTGTPLVLLEPVTRPPDGVTWVATDNRGGGRAAAEHLLSRGHRRIAYVSSIGGWPATERRAGVLGALHDAGLPDPERGGYVVDDVVAPGGVRPALEALLALPQPPTAVLASHDHLALMLLGAAHELGLVVPRDLSVMGFDDVHAAELVVPALTTMRQPLRELADAAVERALAPTATASPGAPLALPVRLVERASVAPA